ncbi:MAG: hypothetical protein ACOX1V_04005 [Candidatus Iainarchaeum sp.]|jgi:hypothetical protein
MSKTVKYSKFFTSDELNTLRLLKKGNKFRKSMSDYFKEMDCGD